MALVLVENLRAQILESDPGAKHRYLLTYLPTDLRQVNEHLLVERWGEVKTGKMRSLKKAVQRMEWNDVLKVFGTVPSIVRALNMVV